MIDCVISLTTWKGRIYEPTLPKVIYRLLTQKTKFNYKVVLVLSKDEFGDNFILPEELNLMTLVPNFEILWTDKNTKALKKLNPTMLKYNNVPIITLDDDELVSIDMLETMMSVHLKNPTKILGTVCGNYNGIKRVAYIRLFPANSLFNIPDDYFIQYFNALHDDEWNGIRAKLNKTDMICVGKKLIDKIYKPKEQFRKIYSKFNFKNAYAKFIKDHPEYK